VPAISWWRERRSIPRCRCGQSRQLNCDREHGSFSNQRTIDVRDGAITESTLLADIGGGMIRAMGQDRKQATPDLFSTAPFGETSSLATKSVASAEPERRHVLPKDLANAVRHLTDQELDRLITASLDEAKRRGRSPAGVQTDEPIAKRYSRTDDRRQGELAVSLTRGQINAVRAAFKAGIKPSLISRQFGISQSDVRKVLASDKTTRG
jgi:hypothetical protein